MKKNQTSKACMQVCHSLRKLLGQTMKVFHHPKSFCYISAS